MLTILLIYSWFFLSHSLLLSQDMSQHLDKIVSLCDSVYISLNDNHPRVLWATIHAIQRLSEHKELLNNAQYPLKFLSKLIPITRTSLCAHLQVQTD